MERSSTSLYWTGMLLRPRSELRSASVRAILSSPSKQTAPTFGSSRPWLVFEVSSRVEPATTHRRALLIERTSPDRWGSSVSDRSRTRETDFEHPLQPGRHLAELDALFKHEVLVGGALRVKLYRPD